MGKKSTPHNKVLLGERDYASVSFGKDLRSFENTFVSWDEAEFDFVSKNIETTWWVGLASPGFPLVQGCLKVAVRKGLLVSGRAESEFEDFSALRAYVEPEKKDLSDEGALPALLVNRFRTCSLHEGSKPCRFRDPEAVIKQLDEETLALTASGEGVVDPDAVKDIEELRKEFVSQNQFEGLELASRRVGELTFRYLTLGDDFLQLFMGPASRPV